VSVGRQIRIFLADGTPGGLLTAEIMNWTGHVVAAPRSDLSALRKRDEAARTGVYVLLGDAPNVLGSTMAYIGEGDDVGERLAQHARSEELGGKDFWDRAIVLTSKDANLTKAHARYLESRFIDIAKSAGRSELRNHTFPQRPPLPEADVSDMEYFITQAQIILPVLSVNIFRVTTRTGTSVATAATGPAPEVSPVFTLQLAREGIAARAVEVDSEFTALKDSQARAKWTGGEHSYKSLHASLVEEGVLVPALTGRSMTFARDFVFSSPSAAGAAVTGRQTNGRTDWKMEKTGLSFGEWQARGLLTIFDRDLSASPRADDASCGEGSAVR
jgi:hypothetical protein